MKVIFLCSGAGSRMRPLSDIYPKSLIPVPRSHEPFGLKVPNLLNTIETLLLSSLGSRIDEILIVASPSYFKREDFQKIKSSVSVKITEINNLCADCENINNQHSMKLALTFVKSTDTVMIVEGDIYLTGDIDLYIPPVLEEDRSYYFCSYRENEWVFVKRDGISYYEIVKGGNGLAMSGLSIINGQSTIDSLKETLYNTSSPEEFWDDSLMRMKLPLNLINAEDSIVEFDTINDLIREGLCTPEDVASLLSDDGTYEKTDSMTNTSFVLNFKKVKSVLRLPGSGTDQFIKRDRESLVQSIINKQKGLISPRATYCDHGIKITEFVDECRTSLESDAPRVISMLADLHQIKAPLEGLIVNLIDEVKDYESLYDTTLPSGYKEVSAIYKSLISSRQHRNVVLCHRDLDPRNILIKKDSKDSYFVDFEYSGLLNKYWDYGAHLSEMSLHFGTKMSEEEYVKIASEVGVSLDPQELHLWKGIVDFIWSCWTIAKISLGESYEEYLEERWDAACRVLEEIGMI